MDRAVVIAELRKHEAELRALGITSLSLFGSTARGEAREDSDVDLAATLDEHRRIGVFHYAAMVERLKEMLDRSVDLVDEPSRKAWLQDEIDRDRINVF